MSNKIIGDNFIQRLEQLTFQMQNPMRGFFGGNHRTNLNGQNVEFADFKEYTLGDDIRHIDWNLYSRFEKHYIKLFVDERQMKVQIFIDGSASMVKIDNNKREFALKAAIAIGYLAIHSLDKVSFHVMRENHSENIANTITNKEAFFKAVTELKETTFKGPTNINNAILNEINIGSNDGLTVIISDFMTDDWKKAVDYLRYKKRDVLLVQVLSQEDVNPFYSGRMRLLDSEALDVLDEKNMQLRITKGHIKAYEMALNDFKEDIRKFAASRGIHYISVLSEEDILNFVFKRLGMVGLVK